MIDLEKIAVPAFAVACAADGQFRYIGVNAVNQANTGLTTAILMGKTPHDMFPADVAERLCEHYRACVNERMLIDYEVSADFPAGLSVWRATLTPIIGAAGTIDTIVGTLHDLSAPRRHDRDLRAANRHLDLAIRCLKGADWRFDVSSGQFEASDNLALLMGEDRPRPVAWPEWAARVLPEDIGDTACDVLLNGQASESVVRFRFRNNRDEVRWAQCRRIVAGEEAGAPLICGVIVDVTDERQREMRLEDQAAHDSLTGLLNRRGFRQDLERILSKPVPGRGKALAVIMLDLDGFKLINDRHGHAVGDEALVEVARRLRATIGEAGLAARLGGDEFVVACPGVGQAEAAGLANRINGALARPLVREGLVVPMGGSVGLSWRHHVVDLNAMMSEADERLYHRKRSRKAAAAAAQGVAGADAQGDQMNLFAA